MYLETSSELLRTNEYSRPAGCFDEFPASTQIQLKQSAELQQFRFHLVPCKTPRSLILQALYRDELVLAMHLPSAFARGEILASSFLVDGKPMLCIAAHSQRNTGSARHWFGIFSASGRKLYVSSLEHRVSRACPQDDGVSLFFDNGDSIRIRL